MVKAYTSIYHTLVLSVYDSYKSLAALLIEVTAFFMRDFGHAFFILQLLQFGAKCDRMIVQHITNINCPQRYAIVKSVALISTSLWGFVICCSIRSERYVFCASVSADAFFILE